MVHVSLDGTLPVVAFLTASIVNIFVPSGGGVIIGLGLLFLPM